MDSFAIVLIAVAVLGSAAIAVKFALQHKRRTNSWLRNHEDSLERQKNGVWANALVVHSKGSNPPIHSIKMPMTLTLEVTPPSGKPYRATTQWSVDISALCYVAQGQEVAVIIDRDNAKIIYPHASWATFIGE